MRTLCQSYELDKAERLRIFELIQKAETFDHFMQIKFGAVKRYGLEGCESMMTALDSIFQKAAGSGTALSFFLCYSFFSVLTHIPSL